MDAINTIMAQGETYSNKKPSTLTPAKSYSLECPECGGLGFFRADVPPSHPQFGKPIRCENEFHLDDRLQKLAAVSGLHQADLARRLADISPSPGNQPMIDAARQMIDKPGGWLYIWGGPGNAKSEVLKAIVNELNQAGKGPAMYTKFSQVIQWMRDSFNEQKSGQVLGYAERFKRLIETPILCIDEMDKARSTEFVDEFRFDFLDERYITGSHGSTVTVFASNLDPSSFPMPIYDRIRDGRFTIVNNAAGSARPHMVKS